MTVFARTGVNGSQLRAHFMIPRHYGPRHLQDCNASRLNGSSLQRCRRTWKYNPGIVADDLCQVLGKSGSGQCYIRVRGKACCLRKDSAKPDIFDTYKYYSIPTMKNKTVLITGCSPDGLGTALVHAYRARDYTVFAAVRNLAKATHLKEVHGVQIVLIDVTSQESITEAMNKIDQEAGGKLDVLVNNAAALGDIVPLLDVSIERSKKAFEVNVWGMLAMCQTFAPLLVKARGTICNVNTCATEMTFAWSGSFTCSSPGHEQLRILTK